MGHIKMIQQRPTEGYDWLFEDRDVDKKTYYRYFTTLVIRPEGTEPWPECTDADKRKWEEDHPQPEPEPEGEQ
ncbi:MAG: hypothetical protein II708_05000 [Paludibacteraceae bacterium]|nr:hypothetical protein [Paludibacteraceae bacterium]